MAKKPRLKVVRESDSGRNERFKDTQTGQELSRSETVRRIENGQYPGYHVRKVHGKKTPTSNPNQSDADNLG